ncbi:MAG: hypothetical protein RSD47_11395 [Romboutsia sp.]
MFRNNKKIKECRKKGASYLCKKEICNMDKESIKALKKDLIKARELLSEEEKKNKDYKDLPTYGLFVCDDGMVIGKPTNKGSIDILFFDSLITDKDEIVISQKLENYIEDKKNKIKLKKADPKLIDNISKVLELISINDEEKSPNIYKIDNIREFKLIDNNKIYAFNEPSKNKSNIGIVYNIETNWMVSFLQNDQPNENGQFIEAQFLETYLKG